jgi:hypothetical protein
MRTEISATNTPNHLRMHTNTLLQPSPFTLSHATVSQPHLGVAIADRHGTVALRGARSAHQPARVEAFGSDSQLVSG